MSAFESKGASQPKPGGEGWEVVAKEDQKFRQLVERLLGGEHQKAEETLTDEALEVTRLTQTTPDKLRELFQRHCCGLQMIDLSCLNFEDADSEEVMAPFRLDTIFV